MTAYFEMCYLLPSSDSKETKYFDYTLFTSSGRNEEVTAPLFNKLIETQ